MAIIPERRSSVEGAIFLKRRGLLARLLFTAHATICVYQAAFFLQDPNLWFMLFLLGVMYVEFFIVAFFRKGKEWKWFFACIFCYLMVVIPALWIVELDVLKRRLEQKKNDSDECLVKDLPINNTIGTFGINEEDWSLILQQTLLFSLIIGRWILPRGHLTSDQHSQLLLVYIGNDADILEFAAEGLRLDEMRCDSPIICVILVIWTISILQFTLPLTKTARRPSSYIANRFNTMRVAVAKCCGTESWAILIAISLQDGPFLCVRLFLLLHKRVVNELLLFFACKNVLTIILQGNRLYALLNEKGMLRRNSRRIRLIYRIARAAQHYLDPENPETENVAGVENGMHKPENVTEVQIEMPGSNNACAENVAYEPENIEIGTRAEGESKNKEHDISLEDDSVNRDNGSQKPVDDSYDVENGTKFGEELENGEKDTKLDDDSVNGENGTGTQPKDDSESRENETQIDDDGEHGTHLVDDSENREASKWTVDDSEYVKNDISLGDDSDNGENTIQVGDNLENEKILPGQLKKSLTGTQQGDESEA